MAPATGWVLVADHESESRQTIERLLSWLSLSVWSVETGGAVLAALAARAFDLIVVAVDLPELTGFEVLQSLRERFGTELAVAILGASRGGVPRDEVAALLLGADDFFAKPLAVDRVVARVRRLAIGAEPRLWAPTEAAPELSARPQLTPREREVLTLLSLGVRRTEIADRLCITGKTAATHIERILAKLGAHSQAQAIAFALRDATVEAQRSVDRASTAALSSIR